MNDVITFHDPLPGISYDEELAELWRTSWARHGWNPRILTRADVAYEYLDLLRKAEASRELQRGPTPAGYVLACNMRWIAFLSHAPGMFADLDVLNNGLTPADLHLMKVHTGFGDMPYFLTGNNCPCAVWATANGVREMVDTILGHADEVDGLQYDPTQHDSELSMIAHDQAIFGRYNFRWLYPHMPLVRNYSPDNDEWRNYPLIHFPNDTTPKPRGQTIKQLGLFP